MSYSVYSTRGFILGSAPSGEAGKTYSIYSEQFGLLRAHAQGVRHLKSKLRYNLADYTLATFSLIRGKELWRITGSVADSDVGGPGGGNPVSGQEILKVRARILSFIKRLVQGEERNDELFAILLELFSDTSSRISGREELLGFETNVLARSLAALGYVDLASLEGMGQKEMIVAINRALRESQL